MALKHACILQICALLHLMSTGCVGLASRVGPGNAQAMSEECGLVIFLNGIEGAHPLHALTIAGLKDGGVRYPIEHVDWTTGYTFRLIEHLQNDVLHEQAANDLAERITSYKRRHPSRPVHLIGHSGGAGIVLMALQRLPDDVCVDTATLVAAAVSRSFPIQSAVVHTKLGIWNLQSSVLDSPLLVLGTTLFGTIDNQHTMSAGQCGFAYCNDMESCKYDACKNCPMLHERPYRLRYLASFNPGAHYGALNYLSAKRGLAAIILQ